MVVSSNIPVVPQTMTALVPKQMCHGCERSIDFVVKRVLKTLLIGGGTLTVRDVLIP